MGAPFPHFFMATKQVRKYLSGPETIEVVDFKMMEPDLGAIMYHKEIDGRMEKVADIVNVPSAEVMDVLGHVDAGKRVTATIVPDTTEDSDGHPEINSAIIEGDKPDQRADA